jgi:cation diffusion facilitator CzcD-associated flavoprotein CzcO
MFRALRHGKASIVTDAIDTFTPTGVRLASGEELEADLIVTATGLNLLAFGGIELAVDGSAVSLPDTVAYKGLMLSGVPNFVFAIGYTNASWTLKVDLVCEYFCRLLGELDRRGADACAAELTDPQMELQPLLDFKAGYVLRALDTLPKQGEESPWHLAQNYAKDSRYLLEGEIDDEPMRFFSATRAPATREPVAA